jgi:hypothetical protein
VSCYALNGWEGSALTSSWLNVRISCSLFLIPFVRRGSVLLPVSDRPLIVAGSRPVWCPRQPYQSGSLRLDLDFCPALHLR